MRSMIRLGLVLVVASTGCAACPTDAQGEAVKESGGSIIVGPTDDRADPVCFPKGSVERAMYSRVATLEPDDGTEPCSGFLVGNPSQPATMYLLSVGRCRPRPNVAVVVWFGSGRAMCNTKAVNIGNPYLLGPMLGSVATGGPLDDAPALFTLDSDAWGWSGLSIHSSVTVPTNTPLVLPQGMHDAEGRKIVVVSHHQGTECRSGTSSASVFSHTCDTGANVKPDEAQGAPILAPDVGGGYNIIGMAAGPTGGINGGYTLTALAPLLAMVPPTHPL